MSRSICVSSVFLLLAAAFPLVATADDAKPDPKMEFDPAHAEKMKEGLDLFKGKGRQIVVTSGVECHGGMEVESGLDLATRKGLVRGGSKGPAVVAGKSRDSNMWRVLAHTERHT